MRTLLLCLTFVLSACPPPPNAGERGEPCLADDKCNGDLICVDAQCVEQPVGVPEEKEQPNETNEDAGTAATVITDAGTQIRTDAGTTPIADGGSTPLFADAGNSVQVNDAGLLANVADAGIAPAPCNDTCADLGYSCGEVCGEVCGTCTNGGLCITGSCYSEAVDVSCDTCSLQVVLLNKTVSDGQITAVDIAIDYQPSETEPNPRIMDLHFKADPNAQPTNATEGAALTAANKALSADSSTGNKWLPSTEGNMRFLAFSASNTNEIQTGRLVEISFAVNPGQEGLVFSIVKREETFAPPDADAALYGQSYDAAIVVVSSP